MLGNVTCIKLFLLSPNLGVLLLLVLKDRGLSTQLVSEFVARCHGRFEVLVSLRQLAIVVGQHHVGDYLQRRGEACTVGHVAAALSVLVITATPTYGALGHVIRYDAMGNLVED